MVGNVHVRPQRKSPKFLLDRTTAKKESKLHPETKQTTSSCNCTFSEADQRYSTLNSPIFPALHVSMTVGSMKAFVHGVPVVSASHAVGELVRACEGVQAVHANDAVSCVRIAGEPIAAWQQDRVGLVWNVDGMFHQGLLW